ncbi:hypothetical protein BH23THE1_BH23THE1_36170 [soil metagenome]
MSRDVFYITRVDSGIVTEKIIQFYDVKLFTLLLILSMMMQGLGKIGT